MILNRNIMADMYENGYFQNVWPFVRSLYLSNIMHGINCINFKLKNVLGLFRRG